jgi:hypothetical protein
MRRNRALARRAGALVALLLAGQSEEASSDSPFRAAAEGSLFVDSGQALGATNDDGVALADLDGDGDLDAFTAVATGEPHRVWINQGGAQGGSEGSFVDSAQDLPTLPGADLALGDLDGDLDVDAFVAHGGIFPDRAYFNLGSAAFSVSSQALGSGNGQSVALGDLDGDGDLDAAVGELGGAQLWVNQGGGENGVEGEFADGGLIAPGGGVDVLAVALGDLDGDGDLDLFLGCGLGVGGAADRVYRNDGDGAFSDSGQTLGTTRTLDVALADFDGDGDLDAWAATGGSSGDLGDRVFLNQGGAQGGTEGVFLGTGVTYGSDNTAGAAAGDVDGDGDLDVVAASISGPSLVWLNQGGGLFADGGEALGAGLAREVALGDLDGDTTLDAFVAHFGADKVFFGTVGPPAQVLGRFAAPEPIEQSTGQTVRLAAGDVDGDGDVDLVAGWEASGSGVLALYLNQGGAQGGDEGELEPSGDPPTAPPSAGRYAPLLGDLDGDADLDLLAVSNGSAARVLFNDGDGAFLDSGQALSVDGSPEAILLDADGDGDLDALLATVDAPHQLFLNQGGAQGGTEGDMELATVEFPGAGSFGLQRTLASGDLDLDGDADLIATSFVEQYVEEIVFVNLGGEQGGSEGEFERGQSLGPVDFDSYAPALGDFDDDGDLDLALANERGVLVSFNDGNASFTPESYCLGSIPDPPFAVVAADFDGDLAPDLAIAAAPKSELVSTVEIPNPSVWTGSGGGAFHAVSQCNGDASLVRPGSPNHDLAVADFDGDGDLDLVAARGFEIVLLRNGTPPGTDRCCPAEHEVLAAERPVDPATGLCDVAEAAASLESATRGAESAGAVDLGPYYRLRDDWLPERSDGQWMLDFYAEHELEVLLLLLADPDLVAGGIEPLRLWNDDVAALIAGEGAGETVEQDEIDAVEGFLAALQTAGSAELAQAIADRLAELPPLDSLVGATVDEAAESVAGVWVPFFADGFKSGDLSAWSSSAG